MIRPAVLTLICVISTGQTALAAAPEGLAQSVWSVTETVLDHHIEPSSRQEMILGGLKGLYRAAGISVPSGLARRASTISNPEQLGSLLDELWPPVPKESTDPKKHDLIMGKALVDSTLAAAPGGARLLSAGEAAVEKQVAGNRYVGLQIAVGMDLAKKRALLGEVFEGGPADRAGLKKGELIEEINGVTTAEMDLPEVIKRLRGPEGSTVTIRVRGPESSEPRTLTIPRKAVPRKTVIGFAKQGDGSPDLWIPDTDHIGYLKFDQILGSTPQELRVLVRRLEDDGAKALVLDLRPLVHGQIDVHSTALLADSLLDAGIIGRVQNVDRVETYQADSDAHFRGRPLALLVDNHTPPTALWFAAALQDNHRAIVVGQASAGFRPAESGPLRKAPGKAINNADVRTPVPFGDNGDSIDMITGRLQRGGNNSLFEPDFEAAVRNFPNSRNSEDESRKDDDAILNRATRQLRDLIK